jgi:hypothetical protein
MRPRVNAMTCAMVGVVCACVPSNLAQPPREKTVWNYDGGVPLITNGSIPNGPCFRINGRVNAPDFFDHLKRIDTDAGTTFHRGSETVTHFPDHVVLTFVVHDHQDKTCPPRIENAASSPYLTRQMMSTLNLYLYWKHGVELRPIRGVESQYFAVNPVIPYAAAQAHDLPERLQWSYQYLVPSAGVPLSDSLVLVLRTPDGHIAARVAARL